jgi:hypothetical protein
MARRILSVIKQKPHIKLIEIYTNRTIKITFLIAQPYKKNRLQNSHGGSNKMKPHLKVGSYFIYSYNHTDAGGCHKQTTYRSVSFKIIKKIYYEVKRINFGIIEKLE